MSSLLENVAKQTQVTFSKCITDETFSDSLNELLKLVDKMQASDLNFDPDKVRGKRCRDLAKSSIPVTSIEITENKKFGMVIFLFKDGVRMPIHDHPGMFGIIKVIHGTLRITSYSAVPNILDDTVVREDVRNRTMGRNLDTLVPVELYSSENVSSKDEPRVLTPTAGNFHEICAVGGTAAIFDILAPPYDDFKHNGKFYSSLETKDSNSRCKIWLYEINIHTVPDYWMDSAEYVGPKISL